MSCKLESEIDHNFDMLDNSCESGECSLQDDEFEEEIRFSNISKNKKHKKKKRKHKKVSRSSSESYEILFSSFNPYNVGDISEEGEDEPVNKSIKLEKNEINENTEVIKEVDLNVSNSNVNKPKSNDINYDNKKKETKLKEVVKRTVDSSGLDLIHDCNTVLTNKGFSIQVINHFLCVLNKTGDDSDDDDVVIDEENENYDEMLEEIPIIEDLPIDKNDSSRYSPEPGIADTIIEPYKSHKSVSYSVSAPIEIINVDAIPVVTSQDPRINKPNNVLKNSLISKLPIPNVKNLTMNTPPASPSTVTQTPKEWENTVVNLVKLYLKPYLQHNDITKDEYRSIMKRAVLKIINSGDRKLESDKISTFVHSYVLMTQKTRT